MTAPKPTRLATLTTGRTEACAPASMVSRSAGKRLRFIRITVAIAAASATTTDHTPATADNEVPPQRSLDRNEKSIPGRTMSDITRLTTTTMPSDSAAWMMGGESSLLQQRAISAESNSVAVGTL